MDVLHAAAKKSAHMTGVSLVNLIFDTETDAIRWSKLKNAAPDTLFELFESKVVQQVHEYGRPMGDARFTIPSPGAPSRMIDLVDKVPYAGPETNGNAYEYFDSKITTKNSSSGFPTPRHLVDLIVKMVDPPPGDIVADPAIESGCFLVAACTYLRKQHPDLFMDALSREHFQRTMFHGIDNDPAFALMANMSLLLRGTINQDSQRKNSLGAIPDELGKFTLVFTNPSFSGSIERFSLDANLYRDVKSAIKAALFIGRVLTLLRPGDRAAVIVPEGVLFGNRRAQIALRKTLVDDHRLDAVVRIPPASHEPFSATRLAILYFTKTGPSGTDDSVVYDVRADGRSLDKKRPRVAENDLPDALARWRSLETRRVWNSRVERIEQSFFAPRQEVTSNDFLLTLSQYEQPTRAEDRTVSCRDHCRHPRSQLRDREGRWPQSRSGSADASPYVADVGLTG